jgi:hypothetical protein
MQRPRRACRAVVSHGDRIANEEEIVKKKRLETSQKQRTNPHIPVPVEPLITDGFYLLPASKSEVVEASILLAIGYLQDKCLSNLEG